MRPLLLATLLMLSAAAPGVAPSGPDAADAPATSTCLIKPRQVVQVGSPVAGLLSDELVDRGERVTRGQVIARMESSVEQADLALDRLKAANDTAIQAETADLAMAQRMAARKRILVQQQDANESAMDELDTKVREGGLRLQQAQMDQRLAALTALRTERQLDLKQIRAPTDGVVTERKMSVGEFVYEQTPIMTIAQIDPLSVELIMPGARYGAVKVGAVAWVRPDAPVGGEYAATVDVVDPVIDAASNTFGVRLVLPNPHGAIPAGLRCIVRLLDAAGKPIPSDPPTIAQSGTAQSGTAQSGTALPARREFHQEISRMTTTFTVATGAELTSALQDISAGADAAPETAYTIALAQNVALSSVTLALEAGSSLTLEGPGAAIIDDLTVSGTVTAATPFTGTITLSGGTLATALATDNGGGRIDGGVQGIAPDGDVVDNAGSIVDTAGGGVSLLAGDVANGSASDAAALISGSYGLSFSGAGASLADATVTNFGSIVGTSAAGVYIAGGGTVTNGSAAVTSASLMGDLDGVQVDGQAAIRNFGTILGGTYPGVFVGSGSVVNGSATDHAALIDALGTTSTPDGSQNVGVASYDPATITTVTNFGTIGGHVATGVFLTDGSVDNGAGGTITGTGQGVVLLASGAVTDAGAINGTGTDAVGVLLEGGGSLSVLVGGTLGGDGFGVSSSGSASVTNLGGISGTLGVDLGAGGTLVNGAAGVQDADIVGAAAGYGVRIAGGPGEVTNFGTISGGVGVSFYLGAGSGAGVVTNAGAIVSSGGASGIAVQFGAGAERLVLDAGSSIVGRVVGDDGAGSSTVLELAAGSAATFSGLGGDAGTLAGASGSFGFSGISGIELDAGAAASAGGSLASLTLDGTLTAAGTLAVGAVTGGGAAVIATGGTLVIENGATFGTGSGTAQYAGPTIEGLSPGETIELASLPGAGATIDSFDPASGLLQLSSGAESATLKLGNIAAGEHLQLAADAAGGTDITEVPCYARGTRILTSRGEMAVEALRCGDLVVTLLGRGAALKPVRWLGRRHITPGRHQRPESVWPVRIGAGALADRQPHRDLIVSPGHRIQLDGALVCAADLVNGASIVQERLDTIEYWHVELDAHDVLLAEGLPAESYLDTGNRDGFDDARLVRLAAPLDGLPAPSTARPCLPYETPSQMWRHRLALRAEALGWRREADPHPWLEVDGARVEPVRSGRSYRFALPAGCTEARLRSRAGRPRDGDVASTDWRRLGLSLRSLALIGEAGRREVALDDPRLDAGFLTPERDGGTIWRWTDGDALLPLAELADGGAVSAIEVGIDQTLLFWVAPGRNVEPVARSA